MTIVEFNIAFVKFEKAFGTYPDMVRERIYHFVGELTTRQFEQCVQSFVDNGIRKPTVADFRAKAQRFKNPLIQDVQRDDVRCQVCFDSAVVEIRHPQTATTLFAACPCGVPHNPAMNNWGLPVLPRQMLGEWELIPADEYCQRWKPFSSGEKVFTDSLMALIDEYKAQIAFSRDFFNNNNEGGQYA